MLKTVSQPAFSLAFADQRLADEVYPSGGSAQSWRVSDLALVKLCLEGSDSARRLCLWVDVLLLGSTPDVQRPLSLKLLSEAWEQRENWPPRHAAAAVDTTLGGDRSDALAYRVVEVTPGDSTVSREGFWQTFLESASADPAPAALPDPRASVPGAQDLLAVLGDWMRRELRVDTVGGALRCAEFGEAGVFGPLRRVVLRRSAKADLEVEATLLGEVNDGDESGGDANQILELYGDRHGAWLLHRRRLLPRNKRRSEPDLPGIYDCDVLIADSSEELLDLAGLGRLEKRLFQAVGILPNDSLRDHYAELTGAEPGAPSRAIDLTRVPDRSRRYLDAIVNLTATGRLSTQDLDLLLRTARQLARPNR